LKPENVLLTSPDSLRVKIIDFGLAKKLNENQEVTRVLQGTPEFVPPEIVNYDPIGFPSDMWSIGIMTFVILTGLSPFLGKIGIYNKVLIITNSSNFVREKIFI
jgi:myosin-light-chain kinase